MSATDEQLAGREGAIRRAAETLIGDGYHCSSGIPTPICIDVKFLLAVLDGERLRIRQLKHEVKELSETRELNYPVRVVQKSDGSRAWEENDDGACERCGCYYNLREGQEPTALCDECAQIEVERFREALKRIHSYPVHSEPVGGAMAMQDIAHTALYPTNAP